MFKFLKDRYAKRQVNLILAEGIFDFILYIDISKGTYLRKYEKKNLPYSLQKEGRYEDLLQSLQTGLCIDSENFFENMELHNILEKLSKCGECAVYCRVLIKGHTYHKRILFFQDNHKENIIAVGEDVTEAPNGERQEVFHGHVTAYLAHELRTSLNSLCGNLHILQTDGEMFSGNRYLEDAVVSADYMTRLVNSALHIFEHENRKSVMKLEAVTLEELTEYPRRVFDKEAARKNIRLQFVTEKPVYQYLYLYKDIIWQIIINLISNAIKYTDNGGTVICHMIESYLEEKRVKFLIEITDTGIGMKKSFLSTAWESHTREGRKEEAPGNGLGLAVTKYLAELIQGKISIDSQPGTGTSVLVNLEVDGDDVIYASSPSASSYPLRSAAGRIGRIKRVLVAEDEERNMEILCRYLYELGILADRAHDGREVIEIFERSGDNYYDVILMDIHMPDINGLEAVRIIRGMDRKDNNLPIIVITADSEALSAEISDYLIKPYCLEDVRCALSKYQE